MSELVNSSEIEKIFGVPRRKHIHLVKVVDGTMYIMHSQWCLDSGRDLRECPFSIAMDKGNLKPNLATALSIEEERRLFEPIETRESDFDNGY